MNINIEEKIIDTIISGGVFGYENGNLGTVRLAGAISDKHSKSDSIKAFFGMFVISKEYSENAVYNKTLNDWRAHTGM